MRLMTVNGYQPFTSWEVFQAETACLVLASVSSV